MHTHNRLDQLTDGGGENRTNQGHVGECRRRYRVGPIAVMLFFKVIGIAEIADRMQDGIVFPLLFFGSIESSIFGMAFVKNAPVRAPLLDARAFKCCRSYFPPSALVSISCKHILILSFDSLTGMPTRST